MSRMISVRISDRQVKALDRVVGQGRAGTRTEAVRHLLDEFTTRIEREALTEEFRNAYATPPTADERSIDALMDAAAEDFLKPDADR